MKISIISVGKIKEKYLVLGINEFLKRMQSYANVEIIEVADEKAPEGISEKEKFNIMAREGSKIINNLKENAYTVILERTGKDISSEKFADMIAKLMLDGNSHLQFVIGGSLGLSKDVLSRGNFLLSISELTFTHQMTRLIILEQIYRCFRIINGEPYHK